MTHITDRIIKYLDELSIPYQRLEHLPTSTSEESARVRVDMGAPPSMGAKALITRTPSKSKFEATAFYNFVIPAFTSLECHTQNRRDNHIARELLGEKDAMTSDDEFTTVTEGLMKGAVPPFAQPILPKITALCVDETLFRYPFISFNAGSRTTSLILTSNDYLRAINGMYRPI